MKYNKCGKSSIQLPAISLGFWHNFGSVDVFETGRQMVLKAFDAGVCHFDLANNYGPIPGSAETNFGRILREDLAAHRDEMFISSKAGHDMWPGVYGDGSSRKNLIASCDQSLRRMGLDYVDVFYSHRYDGVTPIEETMQALVDIVRSGKALYAGISKYPPHLQQQCYDYLAAHDVPCLLSQYPASMFKRATAENIKLAAENGSGVVCFSPLAQGLLTNKYLKGIPADSRAAKSTGFLRMDQVTPERVDAARLLDEIAKQRGQSLAQMALAWLLHDENVTSVIIGTSSMKQLEDNLQTLENLSFSDEEILNILKIIDNPALEM
ncbi:MAG: aldo/keto reductase [Bacteroidales bacterium]|nr:aldo/keto reductase [Bacteroidales bacterium]